MKNIVLFILFSLLSLNVFYSCKADNNNKQVRHEYVSKTDNNIKQQLKPEYVPIDKYPEWKFISKINEYGFSTFNFVEDSVVFRPANDSLFSIKTNDDIFILYFNTSFWRNTGFIIYGSQKLKKAYLIQTNGIYYNKTDVKYLSNDNILLRITEVVDPPIFGDIPYELRNNYLLFSAKDLTLPSNITVISEIDVNHKSHVQITDSLFDNYIALKGKLEKKQIVDTLKIENRNFISSKSLSNYMWEDRKILGKGEISQQDIVHFK
ncbi:MAG: hypothetical protein Q8940_18165 [Bacteroidota bacterium]|nr:hypothetical protein [Bacteroidota bacterium]